jgi:superfamily II DNA or RNA helicase
MITLRPYQQDRMIEPVRQAFRDGFKAPCLVAPTGAGKTRTFAAMTEAAAARGNRTCILAHRVELIEQIETALGDLGIECDMVAAGFTRRDSPVMVASVQTLIRRLDQIRPPDFLIIDECHHAASDTYAKIIGAWSLARRLGVTATPMRLDGKGLATYFDTLELGPTVADLTPEWLSPARVWAPPTIDTSGLHTIAGDYAKGEAEAAANKPSITGDALSHYRRIADGKPGLIFCTSIKHATEVAQYFREAGYSAVMLNGGMDRRLRRDALDDFRAGRIQLVTSCDIFVEGVDLPGCQVGIILRPTQSIALWRQMCGRVLRKSEGKECAYLIDHANNVAKFGRPCDEPEWALTYDETKRKRKPQIQQKVCSKCWASNSMQAFVCRECGERFKAAPRSKIEHVDGELGEVTEEIRRDRVAKQIKSAHTLAELKEIAREHGYKPGWAEMRWAAKQAARERHMHEWREAVKG